METRVIKINGIERGKLTLPLGTSEEVWAAQMALYRKNTSFQKVQIMHNFNIDFKLKFIAGNIDLGISTMPAPAGYASTREFAKDKLQALYQDMLDFCYPEAIAKIDALAAECASHEDWSPIITAARLTEFKTLILVMLGGLSA